MKNVANIAVAGLSGQGVIMYCKSVVATCMAAGYQVRTYEVLGTAHRGTLVMTHIRVGVDDSTFANLIPPGGADLLVGIEPLEGLRVGAYYLADGGQAILNTHPIIPTYASLGKDFFLKKPRERGYPTLDEMVRDLQTFASRVVTVPATDIAKQVGHFALANMAMFGATVATGVLPITVDQACKVVQELAPKGTAEKNIVAFNMGLESYNQALAGARAAS